MSILRNTARLSALIAILVIATACAPTVPPATLPTAAVPPAATTPPQVAPVSPVLAGTSWTLSSLQGAAALPDATATLVFGADGTVSGSDGCNRFSGAYTENGDRLSIPGPLASTMMACDETVMKQGAAFTQALTTATSFNATATDLKLSNDAGILATFVAQSQSLAGTSWEVTGFNNGRQAVVSPLVGTVITANFGFDGQLTGNAGCNQYFTSFTAANGAITFGPVGTSRMFCESPAGVMEQETEFLAALATATTYSVEGNLVVLRAANGEAALQLATPAPATEPAPEPSASLEGTRWVLSALNGQLPVADSVVTLEFGADGAATGTDGCNRYRTTFTEDGANLTINQPAAMTMMACSEAIMAQGTAYMAALGQTTSFIADDTQLVLQANGAIVATFVVAPSSLVDTLWEVTSYNNGRDAVVSPLLDTEITAGFGADGMVNGNAGCNEYFAAFTTSGVTIAIDMPGQTMRFCTEPAGVMEQEAEYLAALQSAVTYSITGDLLEMRNAADQIAVMMTHKVIVDLPEPAPSIPTGRVSGASVLNIRSGPGTNFPVIGAARSGDEGEIIGRSADNRWWVVATPSLPGGQGWVSVDFVVATNAENVPVIASPPPPPTPTPRPTQPPRPTAVPATPIPPAPTPGADISFWADRTNIQIGQCATLNWSVQNVQAVWVYPRGMPYTQFPRTGQGSEVVCPTTTTTYGMRVLLRDGSQASREVTINVSGQVATPIPPPTVPPVQPDPVAGTRWEVVQYNNFTQGMITLVPGTSMTVEFVAGGELRGNAGCNNFFGNYRANGTSIAISNFASTSMLCTDPEGIMQQEAEFLQMLPGASTLRLDGNRLDLLDSAGRFIAILNRIG